MVHAVVARNVCKVFGNSDAYREKQRFDASSSDSKPAVAAVDHATFEVYEGELFGIVGRGGSGKSTLLRLIATQLLPDKGEMQVYGYDVVEQPVEVRSLLRLVHFETSCFRKLSPVENILFGAHMYAMSGVDTRGRVEEILLCMGLTKPAMYRPMGNMAPGIRQMIAIARALLSQPRLLLVDEPTRRLDPLSMREVRQAIKTLNRETGLTILLATLDATEAEDLCDRVKIIDSGRILFTDIHAGVRRPHTPITNEADTDGDASDLAGKNLLKQGVTYQKTG
jgi:ABC-2 type transport system ATP-binding protein